MTFKLYDTLELNKNASQDEIKKAYKKLAIQNHPDKGGNQDKFKEISNAYQILSDETKRRNYDQLGDEMFNEGNVGGGNPFGGGVNPADLFTNIFGGFGGFDFMNGMHGMHGFHGEQQIRRNDQVHNLNISLQEAYFGMKKTIKITLTKTCLSCKTECNQCQGRGQITEMRRMGPFTQMINQACPRCNGSGEMSHGKVSCNECIGTCKINKDYKLELDIPKGVSTGYEQRFKGYGEQKQTKKETSGDLIFKITVNEDKIYKRRNNDLIYNDTITFKESIIGKKISIEHFGNKLDIDLKEYIVIQPNKEYILKNKGMPIKNSEDYGNLILIFTIKYPTIKDLKEDNIDGLTKELFKLGIE